MALGYMDGEVRLGYQLAQICLQTHLFGQQWLSAQHHPGSTVSSACLLDLVREAKRQTKYHPSRRTELLQQRITIGHRGNWHERVPRQSITGSAWQAQVVERDRLQERYDRFCQERARQPHPPRCKMRLDAGFCSAENLTELVESGYDVDTKPGNDALLQALP